MNQDISLHKEITNEKLLSLTLQGKLSNLKEPITKVRLTAVFSDGKQSRRFPIVSSLYPDGEQYYFSGNASISMKDVFLYGTQEDMVSVVIEVAYGTQSISYEAQKFSLEGRFFQRKSRKHHVLYSVYNFLISILSVLLLPVMILDGYVAQRGYKELDLGEKRATGLKAILFHANHKILKFTGFTFSVRQRKTDYFEAKYRKYAKKPCKENQVLFLSERRVEDNSNLSRIQERLSQEQGISVVEFLNEKTVDKLSYKEIRKAAKLVAGSKLVVLEDFYPQLHPLDIRPETKIVQLWHACGAFKTFGFSRLGKRGGVDQDSRNHRSYDYVFVSGKKVEPIYSEAFAIPEENVKALGVPRTDIFFDDSYREQKKTELYTKYPQLKGKKVVLFAPTFRGDGNKDAYYPMEQFSIEACMEALPENIMLIIKHHPFVKETMSIPKQCEDRVLDFSKTEQINDLLFLTDVLITDYSSSIFEAALLDIPMVFYAFDKEEYMQDRDIYGDFDAFVPGDIVMTQKELPTSIMRAMENGKESNEKMEVFQEQYLSALDGNSTNRIGEYMIQLLFGNIKFI